MSWEAVKCQFRATWLTTLFSLILFAGITYFLIWAEKQTIVTRLALEELMGDAVEVRGMEAEGGDVVEASKAAQYEGRIVHVVGPLRVLEPITEPDYNIQVQAVKLRRRVQMYQWIEEVTEDESFISEPSAPEDARKTYWYHQDWRDYVVDSSLFYNSRSHHNPPVMPLSSETHVADNVKIGWLYLGAELKRKVNDYYAVWSDARPERSDIKLHSGFYYHGESALRHEVGDLRVTFTYAGREDDIYTAVGTVMEGTLQPHRPASVAGAEPVCVLRKGSYPLEQLLQLERHQHNLHTWKYRALGFVQVFAATMTLHPDWLTILLRSSWLCPSFRQSSRLWANLVLTTSYTLLVISLPWLLHKPSYGVMVLGCAVLPLLHYSTLLTRAPHTPPPPWRPRDRL